MRVGYLSADLRNHVMGKMMWQALQHSRPGAVRAFLLFAVAGKEDDWTARFRGLADRFDVLADLSERAAAKRIAADDLDILVDLSTHTKGAKPGILALKPARVQITHVASAGTVGLSAVDFKLTDRYADFAGEPGFSHARDAAADGRVRLSVPPHPGRREASVPSRGARPRRRTPS